MLQPVAGVDPGLDSLAERLAAAAVELGDVAAGLRDYSERLEADPERLHAVEERLDALDRLRRKHGGSVESVLAHAERCRAEIARLEGAEERGAEAEAALAEAEARREQLGARLSKGRKKAAAPLEKRVADGARGPGDARRDARGRARGSPRGLRPGRGGVGRAEGGPEPGDRRGAPARRRLGRRALAGDARPQRPRHGRRGATLVFDEIDAGVGGNTARVVGERLRALGEGRQVICITHLPQVASLAGTHFRLEKDLDGEPATATVERLEGEAVVEEIGRMLGRRLGRGRRVTLASSSPRPDRLRAACQSG